MAEWKPGLGALGRWATLLLLLAGVAARAAPPVTPEERAAAFPDLGSGMHDHMDDDPVNWMFLADQLEWQDGDGENALQWNVRAWAGRDLNRLLLRAEGRAADGTTEENRVELYWERLVEPRWSLVLGMRQDMAPGPSRTLAGVGIQGLAPWRIHVEATAYAGEEGQTALTFEAESDVLLTNRWILTPRLEANAYGEDDVENDIGHGLSDLSLGLRLRYEIRRQFAPYLGVEWEGSFGETADLQRDAGEPTRETRLVAGVRIWF